MRFLWCCPFCDRNATITQENFMKEDVVFHLNNKHGPRAVRVLVTSCPNPDCREFTLEVELHALLKRGINAEVLDKPILERWALAPRAALKVIPPYVPESVQQDYREAALIKDLSPKASATLARRCLQGMIRDFWKVNARSLYDEIQAIKDRVDPATWEAVDSVRRIGNIGAHMERDINVILDVDPGEAQLLIELIEILIHDWYVVRYDRNQRMLAIQEAAAKKADQRDSLAVDSEGMEENGEEASPPVD